MSAVAKTISKKFNYSKMEQKALNLLANGSSMTSEELVQKIYVGREEPYYARESVTSLLRALIRKVEINKEPFTIKKTEQGGPYLTSYQKVGKRK